jgi:hypothetical protein
MAGTAVPFDRLVRKEVALGALRDIQPPRDHIGLQLVPFMEVESDDVVFDYIKGGLQEGLAPARAEDAEAELYQKDETTYGQGRASIIDWALKDKYTASDVTRYRDALLVQAATQGIGSQLNINSNERYLADFDRRVARDDANRRRRLDNRLEYLIMTSLERGAVSYNDGKIKFTVDYGRPAGQLDQTPAGGLWDATTNADFDPVGDILAVNQYMYDTYGIYMKRMITSKKTMNSMYKSTKFRDAWAFRGGITSLEPTSLAGFDPNYMGAGYGPAGAISLFEQQTQLDVTVYDSVYQTRPIGSNTVTNNRFTNDDRVILLPSEEDLNSLFSENLDLGFGKTLTSPHAEGNWSSGWYEWEDETRDPWMHVKGTGIKAFPVLPYMKYTYVLKVR